jgi:hypothetical protein
MDRFVVFDEISDEQMAVDNADLVSFLRIKLLRNVSKITHVDKVGKISINIVDSYTKKMKKVYFVKLFNLKKNYSDRLFADEVNDDKNKVGNEVELDDVIRTYEEALDDESEMAMRLDRGLRPIKCVSLLLAPYTDTTTVRNSKNATRDNPYIRSNTMCLYCILGYIRYILTTLFRVSNMDVENDGGIDEQDDTTLYSIALRRLHELSDGVDRDLATHVVRVLYKHLETLRSHCISYENHQTDYSAFVKEYRELDKVSKFNKKDAMTNDERLLYNNLQTIGYEPDTDDFLHAYKSLEGEVVDYVEVDVTGYTDTTSGYIDTTTPEFHHVNSETANITDGAYREEYEGENPDD